MQDHAKAQQKISDLSAQLASGRKISAGYQDSSIYAQTLRLEHEQSRQHDIQDRTQKASMIADASDSTLSEFNDALNHFKNRLLAAANGTMNQANLDAIATELEEEKKRMIDLANTQIDGNYLFAGTAVNTRPIDAQGHYHGNGKPMQVLAGEGIDLPYSIDGQSLFLGSEPSIHKKLSTNIELTATDPDTPDATPKTATPQSKIKELFNDADMTKGYFYLSGTQRDGTTIKEKIALDPDQTLSDLMTRIGTAFGNDGSDQKVDVRLNNGRIEIEDKRGGESKIGFSLVGSQQDVDDLSDLSDDQKLLFTKSDLPPVTSDTADQYYFKSEGHRLVGSVPLIAEGEIATEATPLSKIAHGSLDGKTFEMKLTDLNGAQKSVTLNLKNSGSSYSVDGGAEVAIMNADGTTPTDADTFTVGQLDRIIEKVLVTDSAQSDKIHASIDHTGRLQIENFSGAPIAFSLYDKKADKMDDKSPTVRFNSGDAITVQESHIDFFGELDGMIEAVRSGNLYPDAQKSSAENPGIEYAIARIDKISSHIQNKQTQIGAMSKSLQSAQERAQSLELNIVDLKSKTVDTDLGETLMQLNQLNLGYQAILSTVSKINSLTLLNYLK